MLSQLSASPGSRFEKRGRSDHTSGLITRRTRPEPVRCRSWASWRSARRRSVRRAKPGGMRAPLRLSGTPTAITPVTRSSTSATRRAVIPPPQVPKSTSGMSASAGATASAVRRTSSTNAPDSTRRRRAKNGSGQHPGRLSEALGVDAHDAVTGGREAVRHAHEHPVDTHAREHAAGEQDRHADGRARGLVHDGHQLGAVGSRDRQHAADHRSSHSATVASSSGTRSKNAPRLACACTAGKVERPLVSTVARSPQRASVAAGADATSPA